MAAAAAAVGTDSGVGTDVGTLEEPGSYRGRSVQGGAAAAVCTLRRPGPEGTLRAYSPALGLSCRSTSWPRSSQISCCPEVPDYSSARGRRRRCQGPAGRNASWAEEGSLARRRVLPKDPWHGSIADVLAPVAAAGAERARPACSSAERETDSEHSLVAGDTRTERPRGSLVENSPAGSATTLRQGRTTVEQGSGYVRPWAAPS
jgi:hypothetical protein